MKLNIERRYDQKNRLIYELAGTTEKITKYDENYNIIYHKDWNIKSGEIWVEYIREFDEKNNLIHFKDFENMTEYWLDYDNKNRMIAQRFSNGEATIYEYDENDNIIRELNEKGEVEIEYTNIY